MGEREQTKAFEELQVIVVAPPAATEGAGEEIVAVTGTQTFTEVWQFPVLPKGPVTLAV